jgi:hypothetical protein
MVHLSSRRPGMRERRCDCRRAQHLTIFACAGVKSFAEKYSALPKFGSGEQSSGELRREGAKACQPFDVRAGSKAVASYSVIASHRVRAKCGPMTGSAKQSRLSPRKDSGLLRCARNDGEGVVTTHSRYAAAPESGRAARVTKSPVVYDPSREGNTVGFSVSYEPLLCSPCNIPVRFDRYRSPFASAPLFSHTRT